jgi:cytochrome b pre-mRNA-processing protein 3
MFLDQFFKPRPAALAGRRLYDAASSQARFPAFYADLGAPDTMEGRFELYTLHVILLIDRLKGEGALNEARQELFDAYIRGLDDAFREIGVSDTSVGKKVKKLAGHFYGRLRAYDAAFELLPELSALTALIGRNLFGVEDDARAGAFARYAAAARAALARQDAPSLADGTAPAWPPIAP